MITLYWSPRSRAERMFWALEEIAEPYRPALVDIRTPGAPQPEGFAAASPLAKVPAISDGEVALADTGAIALYLADRYAPHRLAPAPDHPDRGTWLYWMFFTASAMEPAMIEKVTALPPNRASYPWGSFEDSFGAISARMTGRDWIVGEAFSMADFMIAGTLDFIAAFGMADLPDHLAAYVARCKARPARARAEERRAEAVAAADA